MRKWSTLIVLCISTIYFTNGYAQKCASPTNLSVSEESDSTAVLSWEGNDDHKSYQVDVMHQGQTQQFKWSISTSDTRVMVEGLEAGSDYRFKVQASCDKGKGNSGWYNFSTTGEKTTGPGPCPKVRNLAVRDVTDSSVVLTWFRDAKHIDFQVDVKSKNHTSSFKFSENTSDTVMMVDGLEAGGNYHFRVKASCEKNSAGSSDWIDFSTTGGDTTFNQCPKPKNLSVLEVTDSSALLSWIIQDSASSFKVDVKSGSKTAPFSLSVETPDTFLLVDGLQPLGNYKFRVVATCTDSTTSGSSDWSNFLTLSPPDTTSPEDTLTVMDSTVVPAINTLQNEERMAGMKKSLSKQKNNGKKPTFEQDKALAQTVFYPNPSDQILTLQLPLDQLKETTQIQISNLEGKPVYRIKLKDPSEFVQIPVNSLQEGMYQLTIRSGYYLENKKIFVSHR